MRSFAWIEPTTLAEVSQALQAGHGKARLIAGGSDLLGELKDDIVAYEQLISLAGCAELQHIQQSDAGLQLGALVTLAQLEYEPRLQGPYRILAEAARGVATPEIRVQGTLGGNLCQRPRCLYYRNALTPCYKKGGTDCPAVEQPVSGVSVHYGWPGLCLRPCFGSCPCPYGFGRRRYTRRAAGEPAPCLWRNSFLVLSKTSNAKTCLTPTKS